ncbi:MAG: hypothetical protein MUE99_11265 [Chitinophagaceae bacterium]|jgi:8-amino-3,8-dideoxy-alpha-D-manno-octulosonate transaminase|nr:hypothetical protein [Chitinophagaceae bacterium]
MTGFEVWGAEECKEVNGVPESGLLMRYGFDGPRKGQGKAIELEKAINDVLDNNYAVVL